MAVYKEPARRGLVNRGELDIITRFDRWDVFGTGTFKGAPPSLPESQRLMYAHLYRVARALSTPFSHLVWVVRVEYGEKSGRLHYHYLLGGFQSSPTIGHMFWMNNLWEELPRCGMARHRLYDRRRHGVEYIVECLSDCDTQSRNHYELGKILLDGCEVTLSHSLSRAIGGPRVSGDRTSYREGGKKRVSRSDLSCSWSSCMKWDGDTFYRRIDMELGNKEPADGSPKANGGLMAGPNGKVLAGNMSKRGPGTEA